MFVLFDRSQDQLDKLVLFDKFKICDILTHPFNKTIAMSRVTNIFNLYDQKNNFEKLIDPEIKKLLSKTRF